MALRLKLKIDGVDQLALGRVDLLSVKLTGSGENGVLSTAEFELSVSGGGGLDIGGAQEVLFYEYNTANGLITYWYFGGFVAYVKTLARGRNRVWQVKCQGDDVQLDWLDVNATNDNGTTVNVAEDTFINQITSVTPDVQNWGGGVAARILDTSAVPAWGGATTLPGRYWGDVTLRQVYQDICAAVQTAFPAMRPRFTIGPPDSTAEGPAQVKFWDAAATPVPVVRFNVDSPDGVTTFPVRRIKERYKDYSQLRTGVTAEGANNLRSRATDPTAITVYPNPYSARQQIGGKAVQNTNWVTQAEVDAGAQQGLDAKKAPRESWQIGTDQRVRAGDFVEITDDLEGVTAGIYPVAEVHIDFANPNVPYFVLTLGNRLRRYGDPDEENLAFVDGNDLTAPGPPTGFALTDTPGGTYHGESGDVTATFQWTAPASGDLAGYYIRVVYDGHVHQSDFIPVGEVQYPYPHLPVATSCSATIFAVDYHNNRSVESSPPVSFTTVSRDSPKPPTLDSYTTRYLGDGRSEIEVAFTPGGSSQGVTAYWEFYVEPGAGPTRVYRTAPPAVTIGIKDAAPGQVYTWTAQAFTQYGDGGNLSGPLSTTAATEGRGGQERDPSPDELDSNAGDFSSHYTPGMAGTGSSLPTRDTSVAWEGQSTWRLAAGGTGATSWVSSAYVKNAPPGTVLAWRYREGNVSVSNAGLFLYVQPVDKNGAAVGSEVQADATAPSASADGVERTGQVTLPSTATITGYTWRIVLQGGVTGAVTANVGGVQVVPVAQRHTLADIAVGPAQVNLGHDLLVNGSMEIPSLDGFLPAGWSNPSGRVVYSTGAGLPMGSVGDGQYACSLGSLTGTHQLISPLLLWTAGRGYSGRARWLEYQSTVAVGLTVTITARWYDASRTYLSSTTLTRETSPSAGAWVTNTATWNGAVDVPANTAYMAIQFEAVTTSGTPYYGVDALEIGTISRPSILNTEEFRLGSGTLKGTRMQNGDDQETSLPVAGWWKLTQGAGLDISASTGQYKGVSTDLSGEMKADHAKLNNVKVTAGNTLPGSPTTGDTHFYTTYGVWVSYDGTRWLGPEQPIAAHNYLGSPPFSSTLEVLATGLRSDRAWYITRFNASYYTGGGVDGSNYWRIYLRRLTSGISVDNLGYVQTTNNNWHKESDLTSFSNNPLNASDIWLQVYLEKTGAPNPIYLQATIWGRLIYT